MLPPGGGHPGQGSGPYPARPAPAATGAAGAVPLSAPPAAATGAVRTARRGPAWRRGPILGYPPAPGQPGPVYPPGQFSAWNRPSVRASWLGVNGGGPDLEAEPGYSALAISDPSADATTTQTWSAIDDSGAWSPPPLARDVSAHTDGEGFPRVGPGRRQAGPAGPAGQPRAAFEAAAGQRAARRPQLAPWESGEIPIVDDPAGPGPAGGGQATDSRAGAAPAAGPAGPDPAGRRGDGQVSAGQPAGKGKPRGRRHLSHRALIGLLMAPVVAVIAVVAVIVWRGSQPVVTTGHSTGPSAHPGAAASSPALGPWQDITSQSVDSRPVSVAELFPATFSIYGSSGVRTVVSTQTKCTKELVGSALRAAVHKAGCTQVLRASYLSADHKMMATIGVLNLADVTDAGQAGRASGASGFIRQLPAAHGPTRDLAKGTGLESAEVKGHYLILIWAEFANLHAPSGSKQRKELAKFSADLFSGTANISLTSRMVTGKPRYP